MTINELLNETRNPISIETHKKLIKNFSFDNNQLEVISYLLSYDLTFSQKYFLLDGLLGTNLNLLEPELIKKLNSKILEDENIKRLLMKDFIDELNITKEINNYTDK